MSDDELQRLKQQEREDRKLIRRAEAALAQGIAVGMFPEGTRSVTGALQRAHPGAGLLALRSGAPVLPMVITGSELLPFNGKKGRRRGGPFGVQVRIGAPFTIPREANGRKVDAEAATDLMMARIAQMLPPEYRGEYANAVGSTPASP